jgi:hypothetical protein
MSRKCKIHPSKKFGTPSIVGQKIDISRALRVGRKQIPEANRIAKEMGCGTPFRANDGMFEATGTEKKKYLKEHNRRRDDRGEQRIVNLDGGYSD